MEYLLLPKEYSNPIVALAFAITVPLLCLLCEFVLCKCGKMNVYRLTHMQTISWLLVCATLVFGILQFHIGIVVWLAVYLSFGFTEKSGRILRHLRKCKTKTAGMTKQYNQMRKHNQNKDFWTTQKDFCGLRKSLSFDDMIKERSSFLPFRYCTFGLLVPFVMWCICGSQYWQIYPYVEVLLTEIYLYVLAMAYVLFPFFHRITVKNYYSDLVGNKRIFVFVYVFGVLVMLVLVTAFTIATMG